MRGACPRFLADCEFAQQELFLTLPLDELRRRDFKKTLLIKMSLWAT
jgi:hypothetical protein